MENDRPRWRIRLSTLMLLIIIAALSLVLIMERQARLASEQRAVASERMAVMRAQEALARAQIAQARAVQAEAQLRKATDDAKASGSSPAGRRDAECRCRGRAIGTILGAAG